MKKLHKLAAATAMALSLGGLSPYASAIGFMPHGMVISSDLRGDALLFPVFYGRGENFYTISNNSGSWIQGHLRFRGAAWSGELLDMDIILSPGDVFVFRVADIDGDGHWELDQSLDPLNFRYSGMLSNCKPGPYLNWEAPVAGAVNKSSCMDPKFDLIPLSKEEDNGAPTSGIVKDRIDYHVHSGYVEFIGEGVLDNMSHLLMEELINPVNSGKSGKAGQRRVGNGLGTSLWAWVVSNSPNGDAEGNVQYYSSAVADSETTVIRTASDVPNGLGGTAFVTLMPGQAQGIAYNAEAIYNFRTVDHGHRVDNYDATGLAGRAVVLHTDNADALRQNFTYVYGFAEPNGQQWNGGGGSSGAAAIGTVPTNTQEGRISFNNTWGPTLADGDDYQLGQAEVTPLSMLRPVIVPTGIVGDTAGDSWDLRLGGRNSIAEVEEAIRRALPRHTTGADTDGNGVADAGEPLSQHNPINGAAPAWGRVWVTPLILTSSGQSFTGFYFDNSAYDKACSGNGRTPEAACSGSLAQTWYFTFAPTKFFYGEDVSYWTTPKAGFNPATDKRANQTGRLTGKRGYLQSAVEHLLAMPKTFNVEVWNIFENTTSGCTTSPCISSNTWTVYEELSVFSILNIKDALIQQGAPAFISSWDMGRLLLEVSPANNTPQLTVGGSILGDDPTFPVVTYSFDMTTKVEVGHWRPMQR